MQYIRLDDQKFAEFRHYTDEQWSHFRTSLVRIVKWSFGGDVAQHPDIEDITQDILLGIQKALHRPTCLGREIREVKKYVFKAARNRVNSHFRRSCWARKFHSLEAALEVPAPAGLSGDLVLVGEAFNSLDLKYRDRLEDEIFGCKSTLEVASGSKGEANRLYKQNFDARARFRAALLRAKRENTAVIRHLDATFASSFEEAA